MDGVVFVTGNPEKAENFSRHIGLDVSHSPAEMDELQSLDISKIVTHKVEQAYAQLRQPVLVEDVALVFHALGTLPGPFIKFFVEAENGGEKMCRMLDAFTDRSATASCTYAYYDGQHLELFTGSIDGTVAESPRGTRGYGFDMIFEADGFGGRTSAELSAAEYDAYYTTIKPFHEVRVFLQQRFPKIATRDTDV